MPDCLPVLPAPKNVAAAELLVPLPELLPETRPSSSSISVAAPRARVLHVFWDVSSLHPGGSDPRVVVAQLRRVLSCYGSVQGIYAFGVQKLFNWVPEALMAEYAPQRLPGVQLWLGEGGHEQGGLPGQKAGSEGAGLSFSVRAALRCLSVLLPCIPLCLSTSHSHLQLGPLPLVTDRLADCVLLHAV